MKKIITALSAALAALALAAPATTDDGISASLFGGATRTGDQVTLVSDLSTGTMADDTSGIKFTVPRGLRFAALRTLSTEFNVTDDDCAGGSPRFQIQVGGKNAFVYLGPSPSFTGCTPNTWLSSGNLIGNNDACRYDTSQIQAGTQCNTYSGALTLLRSQRIEEIRLVVDSGWSPLFSDQEQTVLVRNVRVNARVFPGAAAQGGGQGQLRANAARLCRQQLDAMGPTAFRMLYGRNTNLRNAFGKCVSTMAKAQREQHAAQVQSTIMSAARTCKAERRQDPAAFRAKFGTGRNAFGRCVVAKARQ